MVGNIVRARYGGRRGGSHTGWEAGSADGGRRDEVGVVGQSFFFEYDGSSDH